MSKEKVIRVSAARIERKKPKRDGAKRANHNALERKRRDQIKKCFDDLNICCPEIGSGNPSRSQILKRACQFIRFLERHNETANEQIDLLERERH
eukprot:Nk52_evm22s123 gene=Nk52_evmTU22s123